jgi:hypothetical protein
MRSLYIAFLVLSSCGSTNVNVKAPEKPVVVIHQLNIDNLKEYFEAPCKALLPETATQEEINNCTKSKIADFLDGIGGI